MCDIKFSSSMQRHVHHKQLHQKSALQTLALPSVVSDGVVIAGRLFGDNLISARTQSLWSQLMGGIRNERPF